MASSSHPGWVATKGSNIVLDPLKSQSLVPQALVACDVVIGRTVVDDDDDDVDDDDVDVDAEDDIGLLPEMLLESRLRKPSGPSL